MQRWCLELKTALNNECFSSIDDDGMGLQSSRARHSKGQGMGKASIEEQTETYADGKQKGLFAAINATTTYGNYLELLPYTYMYYDTIYLRF